MRSLRLLLYSQRVNLLRLNEIRHTRDKKEKRRLMALLPAYALAGLMLPAYGTMLAYGLYTADASDVLILYTCALSAVLALVVSIVRGYTVLFGRRDADLVGALPFSQGMVALSRLVPMYLSALLSTLLLMAPACVLYMLAAGVTAGTLVKLLLIILCTPMLPTALGVAGSAAIAWVGVRFRHKNLLIVLLGVLATAGIVVAAQILPMKVAQSGAQLYTLVDAIKAPLTALYPPALWANEAMQPQGVWQLVLFVLVNALPLAAAVEVAAAALRGLGCAARIENGGGRGLALIEGSCLFSPLSSSHAPVVCQVHQALIRGMLLELTGSNGFRLDHVASLALGHRTCRTQIIPSAS